MLLRGVAEREFYRRIEYSVRIDSSLEREVKIEQKWNGKTGKKR